ncbi:MAG: Regulator of RpoS [Anaerolineae bacterium]|nr:Regulator of RpoS [Anaerolineae bacterium]
MTVRILLVEDQNPYLYEELLGAINGFEFHVVKRGDQALEEFRTYRPDLVLMDVRLPLLDGISAVRQIRRVDLKTPVIVITAYDTPDTKQRALAAGATDFFGKPFSYMRLHQRIKELALPEVVIPDDAHAKQLIINKQRRLEALKQRRALLGYSAPVNMDLEIQDLTQDIEELLNQWQG